LGLRPRRPWHTDRTPVIDLVAAATNFARWADKLGGDIAQLSQLGEITTRAGGSSAAAGKRNPIDAMRAMAAAEVCVGMSTVVTHAKPHELERGLGAWHAEWCAIPIIFRTAGAAMEAIGAALASLTVEESALVVADDRRAAATAYITNTLEQSP
jgi:3-carboxy-cis,cis-muconate cycloisomerase